MTASTPKTPFIEILNRLRLLAAPPLQHDTIKAVQTDFLKKVDQEISNDFEGDKKTFKDKIQDHLDVYDEAAAYDKIGIVIETLQKMFDTLRPFIDRDGEVKKAIDGNMKLDWLREDQRKVRLSAVDLVEMDISPAKAIDLIDTSKSSYEDYIKLLMDVLKHFDSGEKKSEEYVVDVLDVAQKFLENMQDKFSKDLKARQSEVTPDKEGLKFSQEEPLTIADIKTTMKEGLEKISASASNLVSDFSDKATLSGLGGQYQTAILDQNITDATMAVKEIESLLKQIFPDQMTQNKL